MANTVIQLKYSTVTDKPSSLNIAEPAYSYSSNVLFIGTPGSDETLNIGGYFYTSQIDSATATNTNSAIVKRDGSGNFAAGTITANLSGNATSATQLQNARNFSIDGTDVDSSTVSFDGTGAVVLQGNLKTTGVSAGNYGGATQIPTFSVDTKGRLTYAGNVAVSTSFGIAGDAGSGTVAGGETLTVVGRDGISTVAVDGNNSILVDVDNTVVRTTGQQTVEDLTISGNLIVSGETTYANTTTVNLGDNIITLNADIPQDQAPSENAGIEIDRGSSDNVAILWNETSDKWTFTNNGTNYLPIADGDRLDAAFAAANTADDIAGLAYDQANTATTTSGLAYDAANTAQGHAEAAFNVANGAAYVANTDYTNISTTNGDYGSASIVPTFHLAANGRIDTIGNVSIAIAASAITSGTLGVARGGTGATTFTTNGVLLGQGTDALTTASSSTEGHVLTISAAGVPTFSFLQGGTF